MSCADGSPRGMARAVVFMKNVIVGALLRRALTSKFFCSAVLFLGLSSAGAAQFVVTNIDDNGIGSLRSAVSNAVGGDGISFGGSLSGQTILLTNGEIVLDKDLTIDGSALTNGIRIDGNYNSRIFNVSTGATVVLNSLTLTNGVASSQIQSAGGGAVYNSGTLTLNHCTLAGNSAPYENNGNGGGIYNDTTGVLTLTGNILSSNSCLYGGGAICSAGAVTLSSCAFTTNSATGQGGALAGQGNDRWVIND